MMKMICGCEIKELYEPPNQRTCKGIPSDAYGKFVHTVRVYPCAATFCVDYRPARIPLHPIDWPRCVCGELAQEHG